MILLNSQSDFKAVVTIWKEIVKFGVELSRENFRNSWESWIDFWHSVEFFALRIEEAETYYLSVLFQKSCPDLPLVFRNSALGASLEEFLWIEQNFEA
jgi:hypothetical protein